MDSSELIYQVGNEVIEMLLEKNRKYGDSALNPLGIFSKLDGEAGIRIRMDDKLARIKNGAADEDEDPYLDLVGYLILLLAWRRMEELKQTND